MEKYNKETKLPKVSSEEEYRFRMLRDQLYEKGIFICEKTSINEGNYRWMRDYDNEDEKIKELLKIINRWK